MFVAADDDAQVQPQRPVLDVPQVGGRALGHRGVAAQPVDRRPGGHDRFLAVAFHIARDMLANLMWVPHGLYHSGCSVPIQEQMRKNARIGLLARSDCIPAPYPSKQAVHHDPGDKRYFQD
jgi:hypothetical protein